MTEYDDASAGGASAGGSACNQQFTLSLVTRAVAALESLIAQSATFQTWVGAADASAATDSIYIQGARTFLRPFAFISVPAGALQTEINKGAFNSGSLQVSFEMDVDTCSLTNEKQAFYLFQSTVDRIVTDMWETAGIGAEEVLLMQRCNMSFPPQWSSFTEDSYLYCQLTIDFGVK